MTPVLCLWWLGLLGSAASWTADPPPVVEPHAVEPHAVEPHAVERIDGVRAYRNRPGSGSFFGPVVRELTEAERAAVDRACEAFDEARASPPGSEPFLEIDDSVSLPVAARKPRPDYARTARENHVEGVMLFEILVGADGRAHGVCPRVTLPGGLVEPALDALARRRFEPAEREGLAVPVVFRLELRYSLKNTGSGGL